MFSVFQYLLQLSCKIQHQYLLSFHSTFVTSDGYIWTVYPLYNYGK